MIIYTTVYLLHVLYVLQMQWCAVLTRRSCHSTSAASFPSDYPQDSHPSSDAQQVSCPSWPAWHPTSPSQDPPRTTYTRTPHSPGTHPHGHHAPAQQPDSPPGRSKDASHCRTSAVPPYGPYQNPWSVSESYERIPYVRKCNRYERSGMILLHTAAGVQELCPLPNPDRQSS